MSINGKIKKYNLQDFSARVKDIVRKIPKGETLTYKDVAGMAGNIKASRAVGSIMKRNFDSKIPCHRVVNSNGSVGDYNRGGPKTKAAILKKEGVVFKGLKVV